MFPYNSTVLEALFLYLMLVSNAFPRATQTYPTLQIVLNKLVVALSKQYLVGLLLGVVFVL